MEVGVGCGLSLILMLILILVKEGLIFWEGLIFFLRVGKNDKKGTR